jgi:hypothetical protein
MRIRIQLLKRMRFRIRNPGIQALYLNLSCITGRGDCLRLQQHCEDDAQDAHGGAAAPHQQAH